MPRKQVPTPTFSTLRSTLTIDELIAAARQQQELGEEALVLAIDRAISEVLETLAELLELGFSAKDLDRAYESACLVVAAYRGVPRPAITIAERLEAVRRVAARVDRSGFRLYGSQWRSKYRVGDLSL